MSQRGGEGYSALAAWVVHRAIDDLDLSNAPRCSCKEDGWPPGTCPRCKDRWSAARFLHDPEASSFWIELAIGVDHDAVVSALVAQGKLPTLEETIDMTEESTTIIGDDDA